MDQGQIIQKKENSDPHSAGTSKEANPLQSALRIRGSAFADSTNFEEFQSGILGCRILRHGRANCTYKSDL